MSKKPTVLMILDGYGMSDKVEGNAIAQAKTPVMDKLMAECPFVLGQASGMAVGLPEGQMGNSEVGHTNMGAGRIVYQMLVKISKSIQDGDFFEKAYPAQLSGGMQQRAAIARALAYEPTFIMMDEPFAALDYFTREQMQKELLRVQQERSASILFVTHSIDEALILGSQIAVIEKGMVKALYEVKAPQEERNLLEDEMITLKRDIINNLHFI